jgi:hypothetical protein
VESNKKQEPFVVVQAYTLVNPNAVVVKLFIAYIAHATVLGPGRLLDVTRTALLFVLKH